mgnify:CR=1 FL=1
MTSSSKTSPNSVFAVRFARPNCVRQLLPVEKSDSEGVSSHHAGAKIQHKDILEKLKSLSSPEAIEGTAKYGITPEKTYRVSMPNLRKIANGGTPLRDLQLHFPER